VRGEFKIEYYIDQITGAGKDRRFSPETRDGNADAAVNFRQGDFADASPPHGMRRSSLLHDPDVVPTKEMAVNY
jgi:hypothetical protein